MEIVTHGRWTLGEVYIFALNNYLVKCCIKEVDPEQGMWLYLLRSTCGSDCTLRWVILWSACDLAPHGRRMLILPLHIAGRFLVRGPVFLLLKISLLKWLSSGSGGGGQGVHAPPPWPVNNSHKKMAAERGSLYFMFLGPPSPMFLDPLLRLPIWGEFLHMGNSSSVIVLTFEDHPVEVAAHGRWILGEICAVEEDAFREGLRRLKLSVEFPLIQNNTDWEPSVSDLKGRTPR